MKKLLFIAVGLIASSSYAALTGTGSLLLSGTVATVNTVVVNQTALQTSNATGLDIINGETAKDVATVHETSNNLNGYKIYLKSATGGILKLNATQSTPYKISYNNASPISLSTANVEVKDSGLLTGLTSADSAVKVDVTAYASAPAGTYSDTVTITITAN